MIESYFYSQSLLGIFLHLKVSVDMERYLLTSISKTYNLFYRYQDITI